MPQPSSLVFGASVATSGLLALAARLARCRDPLLIIGPSGVGKTVLAQHIHELSGRTGPFLEVSLPTLSPELGHGMLAGYIKGSFTGAVRDHEGLVEAAHLGTLFLDEIGTASPSTQQLLLRVIETGRFIRLGEVRERAVDVRFVAATNADLDDMVGRGGFRSDLLARFGYFMLRVPSLAERRDDIVPLAEHFLQAVATEHERRQPPILSDEVHEWLRAAPWPNNVRELEQVCRYAMLALGGDEVICLEHLPPKFLERAMLSGSHRSASCRQPSRDPMDARTALARAAGNKAAAARLLGVSRPTFYRMLAGTASEIRAECKADVHGTDPSVNVTPPDAPADDLTQRSA